MAALWWPLTPPARFGVLQARERLEGFWNENGRNGGMKAGITIFVSVITAVITTVALSVALGIPRPGGAMAGSGASVPVPSLIDLEPEQAGLLLQNSGLLFVISDKRKDARVKAGRIAQQSPTAGSLVGSGTAVRVVLSSGRNEQLVPQLSNVSLNEAMKRITESGFRVGAINRQASDTVPEDHVIVSVPAAGTDIQKNTPVNLVVSVGSEEVEVPRLIGARLAYAKTKLEEADLEVGTIRYAYDEDRSSNRILSQDPRPGSSVPSGTDVSLVVNNTD
jgi:serine/threonine-protein kinase